MKTPERRARVHAPALDAPVRCVQDDDDRDRLAVHRTRGHAPMTLPHVLSFALLWLGGAGTTGAAAPDDANPVVLDVVASHDRVVVGEPFHVGAAFQVAPGWHVYWVYPGNTGKPTRVQARVDANLAGAEDARFPAPRIFPGRVIDEFSLGYEGAFLATVEVVPLGRPPQGRLTVGIHAEWLACRQACVEGRADRSVAVDVGDTAVPSAASPRITAALVAMPSPLAPGEAALESVGLREGNLVVRIALPRLAAGATFYPRWAYPASCQMLSHALTRRPAGTWVAELVLSGAGCLPGAGGLVCDSADACRELPSLPTRTRVPPVTAAAPAGAPTAPAAPVPVEDLWWFVLLALLGGLILNVMPCVIPVAVPKLLHVVRTAAAVEDPAQRRRVLLEHALAYCAGVEATMLGLATVIVQLRSLGTRVGWGFHFQSFWFLVVAVSVLTVLGLGMLKVFPLQSARHDDALRSLKSFRSTRPLAESFLTGLLVTFLGTPCTAPLLGPALGYAFTQPPIMTFTIFASVGLGLAAPFLLLATWTGWARLLPTRVSERYDRLVRGMGFLLFAAGVWLLGVVASAHGVDAAVNLMWLQLVLGLGAWILGLWTEKTDTWPRILAKAAPIIVAAALTGAWLLQDGAPAAGAHAQGAAAGGARVLAWQVFSPARVEDLRGQGRPVFIDFTADWCMNCKYNEKMVLETQATRDLFDEHGVVALRGDFTRDDPVIQQWLTMFGRAGVPLNLILPGCSTSAQDAIVLPEVYTHEALQRAVRSAGPARDGCP